MLLSIKNIDIGFNGKSLISGLSFDIEKGDKLVFKGKSGSGKTSLLNMITGFVRPTYGSILFEGSALQKSNLNDLRKKLAYLPQQLSFNSLGVKQFLEMPFGFANNKGLTPTHEKVLEYFSIFDLNHDLLNSKMQEISGGEKQRIALISCLLLQREILLLDEPVSALDKNSKKKVIDHLFGMDDLTVISASHDQDWFDACNKIVDLDTR